MSEFPGLFGKIVVRKGFATEAVLDRSLRIQEEIRSLGFNKPLGAILIDEGVLTSQQVEEILRLQKKNIQRQRDLRFGKIAQKNGLVTREQIDACLALQKRSKMHRSLGDILVAEGHITGQQRSAILKAQERLRESLLRDAEGAADAEADSARLEAVPDEGSALEGEVKDLLFASVALRDQMLSVAELREALRQRVRARETGAAATLVEFLVDHGFITEENAARVIGSLSGQGRRVDIEGYDLVDVVAYGGMGIVLRGTHKRLDREVAVKILRPALARDSEYVERLFEEARTAARLVHPNLVQAIDVGRSGEHVYFVMEYVQGETLRNILKRRERLPEAETLDIAHQVAQALLAIHEAGLVHRDIKPQNILVTESGVVKLCDLGICKRADRNDEPQDIFVGSPCYVSPEQGLGDSVDNRADFYSLGATLFHALTGRVPFLGNNTVQLLLRHANDPVPDPRDHAEVSQATALLVKTLMAKEPAERVQDANSLLDLIEDCWRSVEGVGPRKRTGRLRRPT